MNIGVAKVAISSRGKTEKVVLVQPRLNGIIFMISSKEGWCGESHTLPYPGYATGLMCLLAKRKQI